MRIGRLGVLYIIGRVEYTESAIRQNVTPHTTINPHLFLQNVLNLPTDSHATFVRDVNL